jgi:poly(3-hydroxybutyrate) depolymerase
MGPRARPLPVMAVQGDFDFIVPPVNADQLITQWRLTADLADDGANNGSVPAAPSATVRRQVPGGRAYTVRDYADGRGGELMQYWTVHGMGHLWSGGCSCAWFADPRGPDAAAGMYDFLIGHPLPS